MITFLSGLFGCGTLKLIPNQNPVAQTATKAEIGTAICIFIPKKISIIGILLPAPDIPPALDKVIRSTINKQPMIYIPG